MKLICLNAWGGKLANELIPFLASEFPDLLCLQEVVHTPASEQEWLVYRDGNHVLPQRANLFRELAVAFPEHVAIFCPAAQGVLWDDTNPVPSQFGLATFVHKSIMIVEQAQAFVHGNFSADGYGEHPRPRNAHALRLFDPAQRVFVSVTHMHGLRDPRGKLDTPDRMRQARRLSEISKRVSRPCDLRIICGDFNVEPRSETLRLFESLGFSELVTGSGYGGTRTSLYRKAGKHADYMLVDDETRVLDFGVRYEPEVSDHCPLILRI